MVFYTSFLFLFCFFSVLPLLFDNACLPDYFDPWKTCLSEIIAIKEEHQGTYHDVPRQIHYSLHIWRYMASHRQSQLRRQFAHSQFSAMATIIVSKRVGSVVSGVVVWPNQLSRKLSVKHYQRHANTHMIQPKCYQCVNVIHYGLRCIVWNTWVELIMALNFRISVSASAHAQLWI